MGGAIPGITAPCGGASTCGDATVHVWLCATPDCSGAEDPLQAHSNPAGELIQSSFDFEPFEFCGLEDGSYWILPIVDHDESGGLSPDDWTMGIHDIQDPEVPWPARVHGHQVTIAGADLALPTKIAGQGELSPVKIDYFWHPHPTEPWQQEPWLLFLLSTQSSAIGEGMGFRVVDLETHQEHDFDPSTPETLDAFAIPGPDGLPYEGELYPLVTEGPLVVLRTETPGWYRTVTLSTDPDAYVTPGPAIDITGAPLGPDLLGDAVIVEPAAGGRFLVIATASKTPSNQLVVVDLAGLDSGDIGAGAVTLIDDEDVPALQWVTLDQLTAHEGVVYASEGATSYAVEIGDYAARLWALELGADGSLAPEDAHVYTGGLLEVGQECSANPRGNGVWAGELDGATHAFLGQFRSLAAWRFPSGPASGLPIKTALEEDLDLQAYTTGYSRFFPSADGQRLYGVGDCKAGYYYVAGAEGPDDLEGGTTMSRHRIAALDLGGVDADGFPAIDQSVKDTTLGPDLVRDTFSGPNEVLDPEGVGGVEFDSHHLLWDILDTHGLGVLGSVPSASTQGRRVRDLAATPAHLYVIGNGSIAFDNTGLTSASEVMILAPESGQEVLNGGYQWFYDGSSYSDPSYGFWGMSLGDPVDNIASTGIWALPK